MFLDNTGYQPGNQDSLYARITVWKTDTLLVQLLHRLPNMYIGTAIRQMNTWTPPTIQNTSFGP